MRKAVRLLAIVLGFLAVATVYGVGTFASSVGVTRLRIYPGLMVLTVICWGITIIGGFIASVQLWRFRRSGWVAALAVFASGVLYYAVGFAAFRGPGADLTTAAIYVIFNLIGVVILLLPACRRVIEMDAQGPSGAL